MDATTNGWADRATWHRYFSDALISGNPGEVDAAADAALAARAGGGDDATARAAGRDAARRYREGRTGDPPAGSPRGPYSGAPGGSARSPHGGPARGARVREADPPRAAGAEPWSGQLAVRLFATPARWGWQAAEPAPPIPSPRSAPQPKPVWVESPAPDTSALRGARSAAVSRLIWRLAFTVVLVFAFVTFQVVIEQNVTDLGESAQKVYGVVIIVAGLILVIGVLRALGAVRQASRGIRNFEQPYRTLRAAERMRHEQALREWDGTVRRHQQETAEANQAAARRAAGPLWYPVHPVSEPTRVDVFGGDPRRHGWASILVTLGSSVLAGGHRLTVLDLTGQDVGGGLLRVAAAAGLRSREIELDDGTELDLFDGLPRPEIAECLAYALTGRAEGGDLRQERALVTEVLRHVVDSLDGTVTFARLAAGVQVLRQGSPGDALSEDEVSRLAAHVGDLDPNEWTARQLRFIASQLGVLDRLAPGTGIQRPLWTQDALSVIATPGGRDDRKELIDRLLVALAERGMAGTGRFATFLAVAGADHLGADTLRVLSEQARHANVRLLLMIDQPQGDLEKTAGTGGAVCIMKMYNHRDASVAAEFIGKGHRFVINQVTRQVGQTFTDGGGDSFAATTGQGSSTKQRRSGGAGRGTGLSDSRGHTWTGVRNWSSADNVSTSTSSSRVYEFVVEPHEILGMPETAFILVDNSGQGRQVLMADGNPGICLLDRVATSRA
jgi:hypothetical protein